jgi:DNA-directed RNA polymerase subunit RPC12/RpoP
VLLAGRLRLQVEGQQEQRGESLGATALAIAIALCKEVVSHRKRSQQRVTRYTEKITRMSSPAKTNESKKRKHDLGDVENSAMGAGTTTNTEATSTDAAAAVAAAAAIQIASASAPHNSDEIHDESESEDDDDDDDEDDDDDDDDVVEVSSKSNDNQGIDDDDDDVYIDEGSIIVGKEPGQAKEIPSKHKCQHCNRVFTRRHNLKAHMQTHTENRPYKCSQCSRTFRRMYDVKRHQQTHNATKPYSCKFCGKRFARADAVLRHNSSPNVCSAALKAANIGELEILEDKENQNGHIAKKRKIVGEENEVPDDANLFAQMTDGLPSHANNVIQSTLSDLANSPSLNLSLVTSILTDILSNKAKSKDGSTAGVIELPRRQYKLLKKLLKTLQDLDGRVQKLESMLPEMA